MTITQATIRTTDSRVHIDAIVDGKLRESFVLYDGNTRDHENAALEYLVNSVKVRICNIAFSDDRVPTTAGYTVEEFEPLQIARAS